MERRNFLKSAAAFSLGLGSGLMYKQFGWVPPVDLPIAPRFSEMYDVSKGKSDVTLLYKYYELVVGTELQPLRQTGPDCTSNAGGVAIELIEVFQRIFKQSRNRGPIATEILHGGARSVIGNRSDGGVSIADSVKFMTKYGVMFREDYDIIDFTKYNYYNTYKLKGSLLKTLLKECEKHQVKTATLVSTWDEARSALALLQPIMVGSLVGFEPPSGVNTLTRDKDGFAKRNGKWAHAWLLIGIDDGPRPGGCLLSSWGPNWVKGPKRHGQPDGSIWVDRSVLERMLAEYGDSYAINTLTNLEKTEYKLWK